MMPNLSGPMYLEASLRREELRRDVERERLLSAARAARLAQHTRATDGATPRQPSLWQRLRVAIW